MTTETKNTKPNFRVAIIWFWSLLGACILMVAAFFTMLSAGMLGFMPSFEDLENPKSNLATNVMSADGEILGKYYIENRSQVDYEDISPNLINALISTEDERFFSHSGIDFRSLGRVIVRTVILQQNTGGGSTLTQQLAKLLFHGQDGSASKFERATQKLKEWIIAIKLERSYTKEEILTMYLNRVAYIYDAYGIESAAWTYFGVSVHDLKIEQAATLVGMLQNPALYNPVRRPEKTKQRRDVVLGQMLKQRHISTAECDSLIALPMELNFQRSDHKEGLATYFREYIRMILTAQKPERQNYASWQAEKFKEDSIQWQVNPLYGWIAKNPKADGTQYNLYRDGLKIHTTIDSRLQRYAEQAVAEHLGKELQPKFFASKKGKKYAPYSSDITSEQFNNMMDRAMKNSERWKTLKNNGWSEADIRKEMKKPVETKVFTWAGERDTVMAPYDSIVYHKHFLRTGMMSVDPHTGYIKAYVGGTNYKYFMYDMVSQGKRQVGSTIKPFVYALAMKEGHTPCDLVPNTPQTFLLDDGTTWTPRNAGSQRAGEMVSLKWGLANSNNNITAWVMKQYSPQAVAEMIHDLGIRSHVDPVYSLCLGTSDVSLFEMVGAYQTFANKGVHIEPLPITKIEDKYGNVIGSFTSQEREAIDEETAYLMVNLLQGVINQGTGRRLRGPAYQLTCQIGGKTGTTQNHSDGWFMSILPNLVTGVWVGGEERAIHFDSMSLGQASNMAIPVFGRFILKVFTDPTARLPRSTDEFVRPETFSYSLDCSDEHVNADEEDTSSSSAPVTTGEESSLFDF